MNKMIYSNNTAKLDAAIAMFTSEEYRKRFVFVTERDWYYVYGDKKYATKQEAENKLVSMGIKREDIRYREYRNSYNLMECAIVEGDNSEWIDIVYFLTRAKLDEQERFKLQMWGYPVIRVYKDYSFKSFRKSGDNWTIMSCSRLGTVVYNRYEETPMQDASLDDGIQSKDKIFNYMSLSVNDITSLDQPADKTSENYRRTLSKESIDIILRVFPSATEDKIKTYGALRDYLRRPRAGGYANKASETKFNLLINVFKPIMEKIEVPKRVLDKQQLEEAERDGYIIDDHVYGRKSLAACFHRVGDWIVFSNGGCLRYFYNVKTQKKYLVNDYLNDSYNKSCNIGIFKAEDLISSLSNYNDNRHYWNTSYIRVYKPSASNKCYCHYDYSHYKDINYIDDKYIYAPYCYNEDNELISAYECFRDTPATDFLKDSENWDYNINGDNLKDSENYWDYNINGDNLKTTRIGSYKDIINLNRCPGLVFLFLCVKNDRRTMIEQLYKLKLNGMFLQVLLSPSSFKEKKDMVDNYWQYTSFYEYDKKGTNLKKIFGFSLDKIRIYDRILWEEYNKKGGPSRNINAHIATPSDLKKIFGDNISSVDNDTFERYLKYFSETKFISSMDSVKLHIQELKKTGFVNKSPKEFLNILYKIGNRPDLYQDYLRLREQYLRGFDEQQRRELEHAYKLLPEKAKKFKYLRPRQRSTWDRTIMLPAQQYDRMRQDYSNIKATYDNSGELMGVICDMNEAEHIRFLHDELTDFINAHKKEIEEAGFKEAAKRLLKYEYKGKELSIIAPKESTDLAMEGGVLCHCVAGFIEPVIEGTENVVFIRRNDMPDKPYFTMAISNSGVVEQIHCYRNGNLDEKEQQKAYSESLLPVYEKTFDIMGFLKEWAKVKKDIIQESSLRYFYGALAANRQR